jgi:hypothetical protein
MNRINEYKIEPGVYVDEHNQKLVVLDIVNYMYNSDKNLVVLRPLEEGRLHVRYAFPLYIFQQKFKPYEKAADTDTAIPDGMQ